MSETEVTTESQVVDTDDLDTFASDFFGQKKEAAPQETKEDVEQDDTTAEATEGTEAQVADPNEDPEAEFVEQPPKKKTVQDRIDELVKQREDTKREAAAEIQALRKEFEDFKKGSVKAEATTERPEPTPDALKEDGEPLYALGEFDPQYIRDLTRFTLDQERTKAVAQAAETQRANEVKQAQVQLQTGWNTKLEESKTEYPDIVEKSQVLLNGFNDLPEDYAGYLSTILMSMDKGPDVLYYLSNHPEEARSIVNSGAQKATLALGRIEARFMQDEQNAPKPKVSKAPPPPVERARGTNGAFISVAPDTDDLDAFQAEFFRKK